MSDQSPPAEESADAPTPVPAKTKAKAAAKVAKPATSKAVIKPIRAAINSIDVVLGGGIVVDGKLHRKVTMESVTAGDRKVFGDPKMKSNGGKMITALLRRKIKEVEGLKKLDRFMLDNMLAMDRDQLVYELRRGTVGLKDFHESFTCIECSERNQVDFDPEEEIDDTFTSLSDTDRLEMDKGKCTFMVELPEYGFEGTFIYTDGKMQETIAGSAENANPFQLELEIIEMITLDFNGEGRIKADELENLNVEFITDLQNAIREHQFGYQLNPTATCFRCKTENRVRVNVLDFLFG